MTRQTLVIAALAAWLATAAAGVISYAGSPFVYLLFSLVFLLILVSGFYRPESYGYMFLVTMLWLGFWLKFTLHIILRTPFLEPVGGFVASPETLDAVLWTGSAAGTGVFAAWLVQTLGFKRMRNRVRMVRPAAPNWYPAWRWRLWGIACVGIVGFPLLNVFFGINQIGMVPRTILFWPMNAVISWFVTIGLSIGVMTLVWWDISVRAAHSPGFAAVLAEVSLSTISLISRGTFVLHFVPPMVAAVRGFGKYIGAISRTRLILSACCVLIVFVFSMSMVTALRNHLYHGAPRPEKLEDLFSGGKDFFSQVVVLGVDRWIGIEGVMSVQSYKDKGLGLFYEAIMEKREIGKVGMYQRVSNSHYQWMDSSRWQFAAIPGAAAFFYYSGSRLLVLAGLFVLTLAVFMSEYTLGALLGNPFLCSLWGMTAANTVAQFGISPRQMFPYFYMTFCALFCIWLLQRRVIPEVGNKRVMRIVF